MRRHVLVLAAAALVLAGCGSGDDVRGFLDDRYDQQGTSGDTTTYGSSDGVTTVADAIAGAESPAARQVDGDSEYLRYSDDIVVVSPSGSGSTIRAEDLDGTYRSGGYAYLGNGFRPGSPASAGSDGGPGDAK